ncbi:GGDEF domain-containing protein [Massilia glaciei]|uniref:diguanylate cyclase n=1 Tax=Massilia glaciei TaxID=1524097 RepID=A0A2U2HDR4_9BURK|nr:GGDEF domain-containing protein [Massilia glaciei]PWF41317.1 GGDEF domain-containing protein [Massilia glaciei]
MSSALSSSSPLIRKLIVYARLTLVLLIIITVVLLTWHRFGMTRTYELTGREGALVRVEDDRSTGKGATVATLERTDKDFMFGCDIVQMFKWPYCTLALSVPQMGVDLSDFSHMTLNITHPSNSAPMMRVRLINFDDGMTEVSNWRSFKVNEVVGIKVDPSGKTVVPLNWFGVAQWWKDSFKPAVEHSSVNLDRVIRMEIATPTMIKPGLHTYRVKSFQMHGKWISKTQLLGALVAMWILFSTAWPIAFALAMRRELKDNNTRLALLAQINRALELESAELADQAHTDPLTGALNRLGLRDALMRTSMLLAPPMSIIFTDIDFFKNINDTFGHQVGDDVLRLFSSRITAQLRSTDKLVRWGGEEFLILCESTDVALATALAEKLRAALAGDSWPKAIPLTASFGVAQHRDAEEIGDVIERADEQLYRAKHAGRNRVQTDV